MSFETLNKQNLVALIDYVKEHKATKNNTIKYIAAMRLILIGKGHSSSDRDRINPENHYEGTLHLTIDTKKKKSVIFLVENYKVNGDEKTQYKGGMRELEGAIEDALEGTGWKHEVQWM
jgi:hypothetical protein